MTDSQLLDRACALREEGKFREAYGLFMLAASQTDNGLEKAGILLNATTNLTQSDEQERSRSQLNEIRELLGTLNPSKLSQDEQDELIRVAVGIEIEEAEVLVTEGKIEIAIEQLAATPSGVSSKAANWGHFKTGQWKWPGTVRSCTRS